VQTITHQHHNSRQHTPPTPQNTPPHTNHNHHAPFTPTPHTNGPTHTTYTALLPSRRHTRRRDPHTPPYHHRAVSGALPNSLYCLRTRRARSCMRRIAADFDSALTLALPSADALRAHPSARSTVQSVCPFEVRHTHTHTHTHGLAFSTLRCQFLFFSLLSTYTIYRKLHTAFCILPRPSRARLCAERASESHNRVTPSRTKHEGRSTKLEARQLKKWLGRCKRCPTLDGR
jgi:hypothetical protein